MSFGAVLVLIAFMHCINALDKLKFNLTSNKQIIIKVGLGTPVQFFNVMLDTSSSHLCLFDKEATGVPYESTNLFDKKRSSTYEDRQRETSIEFLLSRVIVQESFDTLTLDDSTKVTIAFGLIKEARDFSATIPIEADGILGLGFNYEDTPGLIDFSLLYQLVVWKKTPKSTFKIDYTDKVSGYLTLGNEVDSSAVSQWGSCSPTRTGVDPNYIRWVCNSDFIELGVISQKGNDIIRNDQSELFKFIFDTSINHLLLPEGIFKRIYAKVFKAFAPSDCPLRETSVFNEIVCKSSIEKSSITPINIVFTGGEVMVIDSRNAFAERDEGDGVKVLVFIIKHLKLAHPQSNLLVIGQPLLQAFSLFFHKNDEKIYFFSNEFYKSLSIRTWIFIVLGFIAAAISALLVLSWFVFKCFMRNRLAKLETDALRLSQASNDFFNDSSSEAEGEADESQTIKEVNEEESGAIEEDNPIFPCKANA